MIYLGFGLVYNKVLIFRFNIWLRGSFLLINILILINLGLNCKIVFWIFLYNVVCFLCEFIIMFEKLGNLYDKYDVVSLLYWFGYVCYGIWVFSNVLIFCFM